jgi:hypothetical protein
MTGSLPDGLPRAILRSGAAQLDRAPQQTPNLPICAWPPRQAAQ